MIVECRSCQTRFQLDEARIPPSGIRVRCSKCKEAFFLEHPSASVDEALEDVAQRAAAGALPPDATQDLVEARPHGSPLGDDEDDWEFNHDEPSRDSRPQAAKSAAPRAAAPPQPDLDDDAESFGSIEEFGDLAAGDGAAEPPRPASPPTVASGRIDRAIDAFANETEPAAANDVAADLGEPEDWDLLGEDLPPAAPPRETFASAPAASAAPSHMRSSVATPRARSQHTLDSFDLAPVALPGWIRTVGSAVGWCATAALVAIALVELFAGSMSARGEAEALATFELGPLRATGLHATWIPARGGETRLAIAGELHNDTSAPVRPQSEIWVSLLDRDGNPLDAEPARAGALLAADVVRDADSAMLEQMMQGGFAALASGAIPPARHVTFAAYFEGAPPDARRVAVFARDGAATNSASAP